MKVYDVFFDSFVEIHPFPFPEEADIYIEYDEVFE